MPSEPSVSTVPEEKPPLTRGVRKSPAKILWLICCAPLAPQIAGSVFNIWYDVRNVEPLLTDSAARERFTDTILVYNPEVYPIALLIWIRAVLSIRPALRGLLAGSSVGREVLAVARRRLINLPWWGAGVAGVGWLVCIPVLLFGAGSHPFASRHQELPME